MNEIKRLIEVFWFNQNCHNAGELVTNEEIDRQGVEEARNDDDYVYYSGTPEEMMKEAQEYYELSRKSGAGSDRYYMKIANNLVNVARRFGNFDLPKWHYNYEGPEEDE